MSAAQCVELIVKLNKARVAQVRSVVIVSTTEVVGNVARKGVAVALKGRLPQVNRNG